MTINRRQTLRLFGSGAALGLPGATQAQRTTRVRFDHGVASGDPSPDGAVLWTWPLADVEESGFGGNLIVTNNVLFVAGVDGTHAVDLNSHKAVWSYRLGGMLSLSRNGVLYIRSYVDGSYKLAYLTAINLQ